MKSFLLLPLLFQVCLAVGQDQNQALTIVIKNVRNDKGTVAAALYRSEDEFMKKPWQSRATAAGKGDVQLIFENIPEGEYALSIMHDANKNGVLDTNFAGIPKEGFGFSNNAISTFGPPAFDQAKFTVPVVTTMVITLKYY